MHRSRIGILVQPGLILLALLAASTCAPSGEPLQIASTAKPIVWGTADTTHTAVVALLGSSSQGIYGCTGTVVKMSGTTGYVLTAAHCCNPSKPSILYIGNDYTAAINWLANGGTGTLPAGTYRVQSGSVAAHPGYDPYGQIPTTDFCMLKATLPAGTAVIPAASSPDGVALNVTTEFVGYGVTESSVDNTLRRHASSSIDQDVQSDYFEYTEGGVTHKGGPCEGDSGGPALLPSGVAQSQQRVVGVTSYGDQDCTNYGVSMRVASENSPGGFIYNYLNDGTDAGVPTADAGTATCAFTTNDPTCDSCICGPCGNEADACDADPTCVSCITSVNPPASCNNNAAYVAFGTCYMNTCQAACNGSTTPDAGTQTCGFGTTDPTCTSCLYNSCCSEQQACLNDAICPDCLTGANTSSACNTNAAVNAFFNCYEGPCGVACGLTPGPDAGVPGRDAGTAGRDAGTVGADAGTPTCALTTGDPTCDACLCGPCGSQAAACGADQACMLCLTSTNPPASCNTNTAFMAFATCFMNTCQAACSGLTSPDAGPVAPDGSVVVYVDAGSFRPDSGTVIATPDTGFGFTDAGTVTSFDASVTYADGSTVLPTDAQVLVGSDAQVQVGSDAQVQIGSDAQVQIGSDAQMTTDSDAEIVHGPDAAVVTDTDGSVAAPNDSGTASTSDAQVIATGDASGPSTHGDATVTAQSDAGEAAAPGGCGCGSTQGSAPAWFAMACALFAVGARKRRS
ncbi:MAG: hypothetical protein QM765_16915 [Myxococcales bacterium]